MQVQPNPGPTRSKPLHFSLSASLYDYAWLAVWIQHITHRSTPTNSVDRSNHQPPQPHRVVAGLLKGSSSFKREWHRERDRKSKLQKKVLKTNLTHRFSMPWVLVCLFVAVGFTANVPRVFLELSRPFGTVEGRPDCTHPHLHNIATFPPSGWPPAGSVLGNDVYWHNELRHEFALAVGAMGAAVRNARASFVRRRAMQAARSNSRLFQTGPLLGSRARTCTAHAHSCRWIPTKWSQIQSPE